MLFRSDIYCEVDKVSGLHDSLVDLLVKSIHQTDYDGEKLTNMNDRVLKMLCSAIYSQLPVFHPRG